MANLSAYLSLFTLVLVTISSCHEVLGVPDLPLNSNYSVKLKQTHVVRFTAELETSLDYSEVPRGEVRFVFSDNLPEPHVKNVTSKSPKVNFVVEYELNADIEEGLSMNVQVFIEKNLIASKSIEFDVPNKEKVRDIP